jgi:hypothetical protein
MRELITPDARLLHDLIIFGDTAEQFFVRVVQDESVDLTSMDFGRYFYGEPQLCSVGQRSGESLKCADEGAMARPLRSRQHRNATLALSE